MAERGAGAEGLVFALKFGKGKFFLGEHMNISGVSSELSQHTGYSENDLNGFLTNRMEHYNKLTKRAEEILAASQLNKTINTEEKIVLPAVGCSLGDIDVARSMRKLAEMDPDKYNTQVKDLLSGNTKKFISALKTITHETETSLRGKISELNQEGVARFTNNLHDLTFSEEEEEKTSADLEAGSSATNMEKLYTVMGELTGIDKNKLGQMVKGIKIYV